MSVTLSVEDLARVHDVYVYFLKKGAFNFEELDGEQNSEGVSKKYKKIKSLVESSKGKKTVSMSEEDLKFAFNTVTVCCARTPVEVQNYKMIGSIYETLAELVKNRSPSEDDVMDAEEKSEL